MHKLPLKPLPFEVTQVAMHHRRVLNDGFMDESVVLSVIANGPYQRVYAQPDGMALSSNEEDYAGWSLPSPSPSPFRNLLEIPPTTPEALVRLPSPPILDSIRKFSRSGHAEPNSGTQRWWLFGISGAITCATLSLLLLSHAQRAGIAEIITSYMPPASHAPQAQKDSPETEVPAAIIRVAAGE